MKKILSILMILALFVLVFSLAACGEKAKDDVKNEMTTLKDGATSMMDDLSSALDGLEDDMTQNGNVTDSNSSTGLFEDMTSDKANTTDRTTDKTTDKSTTETTDILQ